MSEPPNNPWYREPWPWFIIGILAMGVILGLSVLVIGLSHPPQMVRGEYQRLGRGLTDVGRRTEQARILGLGGVLSWADGSWQLKLDSTASQLLPAQLLLIVQHPVQADLDRSVVLRRNPDGLWLGVGEPPPRHATLIVQDLRQRWWISARLDDPEQTAVEVLPRRL